MKRRIVAVVLATVLGAVCITGCGSTQEVAESTVQAGTEAQTTQAAETTTAATESTEDADQAAADEVAALIDAIYVQERTENTDKQCADAKAAWDALTDAQKELVEGENADPDYFGRDTGDASKDDPRNQDEIGENEILVVSFGTSFNDSRVADIKGIEDAIAAANPDWSVRRAFTAQIIINHVQARDDEKIDNMQQALDRAVDNGVIKWMFCGHDHLNTLSLVYKGIQLTYGMSIDYLGYKGIEKQYTQRGGTLITRKKDGSVSVKMVPLTSVVSTKVSGVK